MVARIERSLDLLRALVRSGDAEFVAMVLPDAAWAGAQVQTFAVIGATEAPIHGATALPELLHQPDSACP
jgi:hypothetical protein